jgi:DNA-binding NtrC family response regulator
MTDSRECKRVLIVDDEPTIADTLVLILSSAGHEARAAYSAEQALELLREWVPNVAILDVYLPGMNGIDLAIRLNAEYPECRLTLFSGHGAINNLLEIAEREGHSFNCLAKPVQPREFLNLLSDIPS